MSYYRAGTIDIEVWEDLPAEFLIDDIGETATLVSFEINGWTGSRADAVLMMTGEGRDGEACVRRFENAAWSDYDGREEDRGAYYADMARAENRFEGDA